ncbi:MAG TPA: hypothetical protein VHH88_01565, partial [Verrucomicrobiae bacterium]|nr:hypothetical protein [Verrucomicrobiae bacterium]
ASRAHRWSLAWECKLQYGRPMLSSRSRPGYGLAFPRPYDALDGTYLRPDLQSPIPIHVLRSPAF